ncbi:structural maintenance of chromosomes flexible hinge domain-containing protein 1-like isoform X2 [Betta splendens]|uniref:Structural maintenance of chromosomes flexible hinge domain-containing protein 1-like isoform X2 n=1 Tax=Betta splendens TaxID=158456 RepID=A0A6P7M6K9_BETSP|nr:structural maintenance of chromosomes flexible hinge domain-containing protein 1-like isoform X2 [Betta splendens]
MKMSGDSGSSLEEGRSNKRILVYDCRDKKNVKKLIKINGLDYNDFLRDLHEEFKIPSDETFVVTTTDRTVIHFDEFGKLQDGITLYLLQRKEQALPVAVEEEIKFMPHYDTLIRAGLYEYYASEGQNPLPYALAELVDNSLSATAKIKGTRTIEIRLMFDESLGKPAVIVLDNGCGMTPQQLNNWAVYRLSKFTREESTFASGQGKYVRPDPVPRSLNSDVSYFGVGGKQAAFYIGTSTRMISKFAGSPDVHELLLSKEDFERKAKNKEDIYSTTIKNRKPCDSSHVKKNDERFLRKLIAEEKGKESFTAVVITGVQAEHVKYLKQDFKDWTRRLAHIYHYYIHGVNGNDLGSSSTSSSTNPALSNIDIQVTLREKPPKIPCVINLTEVEDDLQTLYINAAADTFEFKASIESDGGTVEGIIRYHPFLYDRETYPQESPVPAPEADSDDEDDVDDEPGAQARGKRPVFECFWNGRLIPYTKIDILDWCTRPKGGDVPPECYSRFSGVLFTDDRFEVSTNKLTFSDLELKLRKQDTIFTYVVNEKKPQRANIQSKFTDWLKKCHARFDKQVKFLGFKGVISREDVQVKKRQHPWSTFTKIECGNNKYKAGQLIKSKNTSPVYCGKVIRFLVYGEYKEGDFATGGQVEVALEPKGLYDKTKIIPISKIDTLATNDSIQKNIDSNSAKLPDTLKVEWPNENAWSQNDVHPAGARLGPLNVYILNKKGEILTSMPALGKSRGIIPNVRLRILYHGLKALEEVATFTASYLPKWSFWFKENANLTKLGKYTLILNAVVNDKTNYGGGELPSYTLDFSLEAGAAHSFIVNVTSPTIQVGVPFDLPLTIRDFYSHAAKPPPDVEPVLKCSDLDVTYESVKSSETSFIIKRVIARGKIQQTKIYNLSVTLPGLIKETKVMEFSVLPGPSRSLHVSPDDSPITVENGNPVRFNVEIHDEAGNITACPEHVVRCQGKGLPPVEVDCSKTGAAHLETKPIKLKITNGKPQKLKVQLNIPSQRKIKSVTKELMVVPSTRVSMMKLYIEDDENLVLRNNEKIEWLAGGLLENLVYKLYDEAGREVPLTSEIASMIKVNWTGDLVLEDLLVGKLPDLQVPMRVQEERFYQVSYQDQSVSVSFTITPRPDEPARLKATIPQNRVKLGETLSTNINLELVDQYGNVTKTLNSTYVNGMTVKAADLDQSAVTFIWQESTRSVHVAGVCFKGGTPGPRELCFTYASYVESAIVTVTAGDPAELKLVSGPDQPLQVINDHGIPKPFLVQLVDKWGNPSSDQRVVVEVKLSPPTLKVTTTVTSQPVDTEGKASFTVTSVSGTKGYYQLNFTGSLNMKPVPGPSVNLIVLPNPKKAVSLSVEYDTSATFPAGGNFTLFSVTVVSDEGAPMTTFSPAAVSMRIWSGVSSEGPLLYEMKCSKPLENERKDCFHFRDKEIPERVGKYSIQFHLNNKTTSLESKQIIINVVANQPVRLRPDSNPQHPVVSFSKDIANRTLVQNMTLRIMDAYGNPAGQDLDGTVVVSIKNYNGESEKNLLFEDRSNTQCLKLEEGKVHIPRLAIMEDCPGEDGSAYTLLFKPEVPVVSQALEPFELPFHFYNDEANQRKMCELSKKKEELTSTVSKYSGFFNESKQLFQLLTVQHKAANRHISDIKKVLDRKKMKIAQASSIRDINRFINEKRAEAETILQSSRRIFSVPDPFRGQQGVLGMVGSLAYVEDDAAAHMISWNLRGYMDCVITTTTESAMRIHRDTQGRQKVMALESIFVHQGSRPLPHIRNHCNVFDPPGNPVFARELLIFPHYTQECDIVFKNILGDTILIDDLASANQYRKQVVQNKTPCPTILTRQGDLVSAKGMFGGSQNKAPPIHTLQVFGSPPPENYYMVKEQIDLAYQYQVAMEKHLKAAKEYEEHVTVMNSPDTLKKKEDMEAKRRQLEMIEGQLAFTPVRPQKRGFQGLGESSVIDRKRARHRPI